jgi:hypothetical protein
MKGPNPGDRLEGAGSTRHSGGAQPHKSLIYLPLHIFRNRPIERRLSQPIALPLPFVMMYFVALLFEEGWLSHRLHAFSRPLGDFLNLSNRTRPIPGIATTRRTPLRHLSGSVPQIKTPNPLHNCAAHGVHGAPWRQQTGRLSCRFLHLEQTNARIVPYACRALGHHHLACKDEAPEERFVPAHGEGRPFEGVVLDRRGLNAANVAFANSLQGSCCVGGRGAGVSDFWTQLGH